MTRNSRPLRVLCCSGSLEGGGSERQLWQLVCHLDRQQFQPGLYLLYNRGVYLEQVPKDVSISYFWNEDRERLLQHNARLLPTPVRRHQIHDLSQVIRQSQIDLVYDRTFHMTLVTSAACSRTNTPRVSVIVSPPSQDFRRSDERFKFFKKWILARAYRSRRDVTIAVSDEVARDAASFYHLPLHRIHVIPNPIDIASVQVKSTMAFNLPIAEQQQHRIAIIGRLSKEKGHRLIFDAIRLAHERSTANFVLDVVGDGPDRQMLEGHAKKIGIFESVRFHGFQSNPYPLMKLASLVCVASDYEGLPNVALEAMAIGTGLVATDCSESLRKLIGSNLRGVLVPMRDPASLAKVFVDLDSSQAIWMQRREAAFDWVSKHHAIAPWLGQMQTLLAATK
jgi:glycosyltransferase involved in cell wall biosynthesis